MTNTLRYLGACPACQSGLTITPTQHDDHDGGKTIRVTCHACGANAVLRAIYGTYKESSPCDDRCMAAIGPKCECACAGVNHGAGYIPVNGYSLAFADAANAKRKASNAKRAATNAAKAAAKREATAAALADRRTELLTAYPALARLGDHLDNQFMDDMWNAWDADRMTDRQAAAAARAVERNEAAAARRAAQGAVKAAAIAAGVAAPVGQFDGRVTVKIVTMVETHFTYYGEMSTRMQVEHADGWSAWMTLPAALDRAVAGRFTTPDHLDVLRTGLVGKEIDLKVTLSPGKDAVTPKATRPRAKLAA